MSMQKMTTHKYQLKFGYRDGSVAPQDFDTGKVFNGSITHEYSEPNEFIKLMLEGGYIEEVFDEPVPIEEIEALREQVTERKKRGRPKINGELTTE